MIQRTPEQEAIIAFAKSRSENLIVNALAGTGKTSTIEMVCHAVQGIPILYVAFNKRIVDEAMKRMPSHVECRTQNSIGHRVWAAQTGHRLIVEGGKMRDIARGIISEYPRQKQDDLWDSFADIMRWIQRAKREGFVPASWDGPHREVMTWDNLCDKFDDEPPRAIRDVVWEALTRSIAASYEGLIDYDDQIYMPVIFGGTFPKFPLVIIDEAQDWSPLGHEMLHRLYHKRLIAVGDPWQSIYAFRGAVTNGMRAMQDAFSAEALPLSVTFRVPKVGVARANERVPHYQAFHENAEGEILELGEWDAHSVPPGAAIICRNNAPLLSLAFRLLRSGVGVQMVGFDIGAGLVRILKKLGPPGLQDTAGAVQAWLNEQLKSSRKSATAYDRAECLFALCEGRRTLGDAIASAEALFAKKDGTVQLLSGHKSKGLEFDDVFHLDPWRVPAKWAEPNTEEWEQELNVKYVIETRFKKRLFLANLEGFI